ncbi:hypothetical protein NLU13_2019 [Sarocladium strictum]|uniref:Endonuclease/exonuclease/phosphatase domain-containing protein n=1 Tax=Sarocladium strictum TaxID=5046 RepID=A0AA39LD22_SARSR|nr:hypothetical protein NLU13_2019 [Sarocladium strictum]
MEQADPSRSSTARLPKELNLLTLNCWGLLYISTLRTERLREIGRQIPLLSPVPDIVCLQECWVQDDYKAIREATRQILPYGKFYHSGAFGGGLVILSRWPIEESSMIGYPLNGRPTAFFRGDWYVGKGVARASIRIGPGKKDIVDVFNTHTHAPYGGDKEDSYTCHRIAQTWELAKLLATSAALGHLTVALGDFNSTPLSIPHRIITERSPVLDTWRVLHPDSSLGAALSSPERERGRPIPTAQFNLRENGTTSDGSYNTWRFSKKDQKRLRRGSLVAVSPDQEDLKGKRLDYIFASNGDLTSDKAWVVKSAQVALADRHADLHVSLSDHFAVQATLALHPIPSSSQPPSSPPADPSPSHPVADFDAQLRHVKAIFDRPHPDPALMINLCDDILPFIARYKAREIKQRYWRGVHFYIAIAVWIGCLVAVWFSPANFVAFILLLIASLGLVAGVIDGLMALLFFSSEIRALKEFEWEVENTKELACRRAGVSSSKQS